MQQIMYQATDKNDKSNAQMDKQAEQDNTPIVANTIYGHCVQTRDNVHVDAGMYNFIWRAKNMDPLVRAQKNQYGHIFYTQLKKIHV